MDPSAEIPGNTLVDRHMPVPTRTHEVRARDREEPQPSEQQDEHDAGRPVERRPPGPCPGERLLADGGHCWNPLDPGERVLLVSGCGLAPFLHRCLSDLEEDDRDVVLAARL